MERVQVGFDGAHSCEDAFREIRPREDGPAIVAQMAVMSTHFGWCLRRAVDLVTRRSLLVCRRSSVVGRRWSVVGGLVAARVTRP